MAESEKQELVFPELEPGMRFGRYELRREVGRGGMGVVWEAKDHTLGETIALKFLPEILAADKTAMKLLKEEALILLSLTHPNIVRVRNLESQARRAFIVEEFLRGETLEALTSARLEQGRSGLTAKEALWILSQVGPALDYAHSEGVTHRDIKPANMMLDMPIRTSLGKNAAKLKMMDFGLAFVATSTITMKTGVHPSGTLPYMSPEVLTGAQPTPQADIYSLGTTLYTLIDGECPFAHGDIFNQILTVTPPPLDSGIESLDVAIAAAMAKDPGERPVSTKLFCALARGEIELEEALGKLPEDEESTDGTPGRGRRTAITVGALAVMLLTGVAFFVPSIRDALFGDEEFVAEAPETATEPKPVPTIPLTSLKLDGNPLKLDENRTVYTKMQGVRIAFTVDNALSSEIEYMVGLDVKTCRLNKEGASAASIRLTTAGETVVVKIEPGGGGESIKFTMIYDPDKPEMTLVSPEDGADTVATYTYDFSMDVDDESPVEVFVDSHPCKETSEGHFIAQGVSLPKEGRNDFKITATDRAGNSVDEQVWVFRDMIGPELLKDDGVKFTSLDNPSEELEELPAGERILVTMKFKEQVTVLYFNKENVGENDDTFEFYVDVPQKGREWEITWSAHDYSERPTEDTLKKQVRTKYRPPPNGLEVVELTTGHPVDTGWHGFPRMTVDPHTGIHFVLIDPGTFLMGSSEWEGRMDETPRHSRTIEHGFYLATTEVTFAEWERFIVAFEKQTGIEYQTGPERTKVSLSRDTNGNCIQTPDANWRNPIPTATEHELEDDHPVTQVTWEDAREFCRQYGYRLPREDEWEYACRAGRTGLYWWGDVAEWGNGKSNFADESLHETFSSIEHVFPFDDGHVFTAPVSKSGKNPWGLHGMLGNVWEWCGNAYLERAYESDYFDEGNPNLCVIRGGSWRSDIDAGRCARRGIAKMDEGSDILGFRVVIEILEETAPPLPEPTDDWESFIGEWRRFFEKSDESSVIEPKPTVGNEGREMDEEGILHLQGDFKGRLTQGYVDGAHDQNGLRTGKWSSDDLFSGEYTNGVKSGRWEELHPDGWAKGRYEDGHRAGKWSFFENRGDRNPIYSGDYSRAATRTEDYFKIRGSYLNNERHGLWVIRWPSGQRMIEGTYHHGSRKGKWRLWHADGTPAIHMVSGEYEHGLLVNKIEDHEWKPDELDWVGAQPLPSSPPDLERLPIPDRGPVTEDSWRDQEKFLDTFRTTQGSRRDDAKNDLRTAGRDAFPVIAHALTKLDLDKESERESARILHEIMADQVGTNPEETWRNSARHEDLEFNRRTILRWHTLWSLCKDDELFWDFDIKIYTVSSELDPLEVGHLFPGGHSKSPRRREKMPTEKALKKGLKWLMERQGPEGNWSAGEGHPELDIGVTSLAILALMDGNEFLSPENSYQDAVSRGIRWLLKQQHYETGMFGERSEIVALSDEDEKPPEKKTCRKCNGARKVACNQCSNSGRNAGTVLCGVCNGSGKNSQGARCQICGGVGRTKCRYCRGSNLVQCDRCRGFGLEDDESFQGTKPSVTLGDGFPYKQALATIVFCRAVKERRSPSLMGSAQNAADFIRRLRNPDGVWGYESSPGGYQDTSVTGWMIFATKVAEESGLKIDSTSYANALVWFEDHTSQSGTVAYNEDYWRSARVPGTNDKNQSYVDSSCMTAVGLRSRFFLEVPKGDPVMENHAEALLKTLPSTKTQRDYGSTVLSKDMYYWYHGTYAMKQMGGKYWRNWDKAMKKILQEKQSEEDGSWPSDGPWGYAGGRVYSTAMACMCLSVYYSE